LPAPGDVKGRKDTNAPEKLSASGAQKRGAAGKRIETGSTESRSRGRGSRLQGKLGIRLQENMKEKPRDARAANLNRLSTITLEDTKKGGRVARRERKETCKSCPRLEKSPQCCLTRHQGGKEHGLPTPPIREAECKKGGTILGKKKNSPANLEIRPEGRGHPDGGHCEVMKKG